MVEREIVFLFLFFSSNFTSASFFSFSYWALRAACLGTIVELKHLESLLESLGLGSGLGLVWGGVRAAQALLLPLEAFAEAIAAAAARVLRGLGALLAIEDLVAFLAGVPDLLTILADPALVLATFAMG